jgi:hypothetical protein
MPARDSTADTRIDREARATVPPPLVPPQPVVRFDTLPDRRLGSWEAMKRIDNLAPAKGIMLSLLLGMTLWGCIVAFCLR